MRCRSCGNQVRRGLGVCPVCGASLGPVHVLGHKVRCRSCGKRVPSGVRICPHCGARLRSTLRTVISILVVLILLEGLVYVGKFLVPWDRLRALWSLVDVPEVTFLVTPTFTATRTVTATLTRTQTHTAVPTYTSTGTEPPPTETATRTPTGTRAPAPSATPQPRFGPPRLLAPDDGLDIRGGDAQISLTWEPVGALAEDEWYAVSVTFLAGGATQYSGSWTKDTYWTLPGTLYGRAGQTERSFQWEVTVMKQTGTKVDGGREGVAVSQSSVRRTFFWY